MAIVLVSLIALAGIPIIYSRIKQYWEKRRIVEKCRKKGIYFQTIDETAFATFSFGMIFIAACIFLSRNLSNLEAVCVWIVVAEISLSEMVNVQIMKRNYYGDEQFIYYRYVFHYTDIQQLRITTPKLLPMPTNMVELTNNKMFNVSSRFLKVLQQKTGLTPIEK